MDTNAVCWICSLDLSLLFFPMGHIHKYPLGLGNRFRDVLFFLGIFGRGGFGSSQDANPIAVGSGADARWIGIRGQMSHGG